MNTIIHNIKENPKDRISLEIGDSKQPNFKPQVKVMRWDNEINFSARLITIEQTPIISAEADKIIWSGDKTEARFYDLAPNENLSEGGYEFEVILKEKPQTNKIEFTLNIKGVDFFYQPEFTPEEIARGNNRPENVIGSYAVYASEQKANIVNGKEYKCGKVGHIYRPQITDSMGNKIWGILKIDNEILSIEIPQQFLDNAIYPITVDPTFGYTTQGASDGAISADNFDSSMFTSPTDVLTATNLTFYCFYASGTPSAKGILVLLTNLNILTNGVENAVALPASPGAWTTSTFATPPNLSASTEYVLGMIPNASFRVYFDSGDTNQQHFDSSNSYATPTNPTDASHFSSKYSIYCTYTAPVIAVGGSYAFFM